MILYLGTSSLIKLYLDEEHSDSVQAWCEEAEILTTSKIALPEAMSALARRHCEGDLEAPAFEEIHDT